MKTHFLLLVMFIITFLMSCSQENITENKMSELVMTALDFQYDDQSRTHIEIDKLGGKFSWSEKDTVGVFPDKGGQVYFPMISGAGTNSASFDGGGWALKPSSKYISYYPFIGNMFLDKTCIPIKYDGQIQVGNASTDHLSEFDYMMAFASTPIEGKVDFEFRHLGALLELNIPSKLPTIDILEFIANTPVFIHNGTIDITSNPPFITGNKYKHFTFYLKNIDNQYKKSPINIYMLIPPTNFTNCSVKLKASNSQGSFEEYILPLKNIEAGKAYSINALKEDIPDSKKAPMILVAKANVTNNFTIELPLIGYQKRELDCVIDWGDGIVEHYINKWPISHKYNTSIPTSYEINISGNVYGLSSLNIKREGLIEVKQWGDLGLRSMNNAFCDNKDLIKIADDTSGAFKNIENFNRAFMYCTSLKEIPEGLFTYCQKVNNFNSVFNNCHSLKELPLGLFENCESATTFENAFSYCKNLISVPNNIFKNCHKVTTFRYAFSFCEMLSKLPREMFIDCENTIDFYSIFQSCYSLVNIPDDLFKYCPKATNLKFIFSHCHSLVTIPSNLFDQCKDVVHLMNAFSYCNKLESIPKDLFKNCSKVTSFEDIFYNDISIKEIPSNLFDNCLNVTSFEGAFNSCRSIKAIPYNLFHKCVNATNFEETFNSCISLECIPEGLFDKNVKVDNFNFTFCNCSSLKYIPCNLFAYTPSVIGFMGTFKDCKMISGESPYNFINDKKYHLYEREKNQDYFITPNGLSCFEGCVKLSDYKYIPKDWKGL